MADEQRRLLNRSLSQDNPQTNFDISGSSLSSGKKTPVMSNPSISTDQSLATRSDQYKVYKRRWYMLSVLVVLNFSNAIGWISFAPVADYAATFYKTSFDNINYLSLIYMVASIPFGFVSSWVLDTFGLRTSMMLGAWFNITGLVIRCISTIEQVENYNFVIVLIGQGISAIAQPFLMFATTKLAATWFPDTQRVIANTIGSASNPMGILAAYIFSGIIVQTEGDMQRLMWIYAIPGGVGAIMMTLGFWHSVPPTPPSASAADTSETFIQGVKKVICNRAYMVLLLAFGAGLGLFSVISSILEQVLCSRGYTDQYASLVGILVLASGMMGSVVTGIYTDKTKKFTFTAKCCFALSTIGIVGFCVLSCYPSLDDAILASAIFFGVFSFGGYPVILELGVETTYPVAEGTSTGFLVIAGQVQGIALIFVVQFLAGSLTPGQQAAAQCQGSVTPQDFTLPLLIIAGYISIIVCIFLIFFKTDYHRLRAEERHAADSILNFSSRSHGQPAAQSIYE